MRPLVRLLSQIRRRAAVALIGLSAAGVVLLAAGRASADESVQPWHAKVFDSASVSEQDLGDVRGEGLSQRDALPLDGRDVAVILWDDDRKRSDTGISVSTNSGQATAITSTVTARLD